MPNVKTILEYVKLLGMTVVFVLTQAILLNTVPIVWTVYNEIKD